MSDDLDELIDSYLGQYHLIEIIGHGGMATVYKAYQPGLERFVAIKVLPRTRDPELAARFKREALTIGRLHHPNIITVYDHGTQDGLLYLVMQYVEDGRTLGDLMRAPMDVLSALRLMGQLLTALEYAHQRQVIHRDIKPSNVLLAGADWPVLADFGIAKIMDESQRFTATGMIFGTAAYMAPEQAIGQSVDRRTDLYSSGVILYELMTGRVPFDAQTPLGVLHQHVYEPPPPPRSLNAAIPIPLEAVLLRALAKDPRERYQTAAEMAEQLGQMARWIGRSPSTSRPDALTLELGRSPSTNRLDHFYQEGLQAFSSGNWELAVQKLERLIAIEPANEDAVELLENAREHVEQAHRVAQAIPGNPQQPLTQPQSGLAPPVSRAKRLAWTAAIVAVVLLAVVVTFTLRADLRAATPAGQPTAQPTDVSTSQAQVIIASIVADAADTVTPIAAPVAVDRPTNTTAPTSSSTSTAAPTPSPTQATPTQTARPPDALVNADTLILRDGPGQQFASLRAYRRNTALVVLGRNSDGTWLRVKGPDERSGWMLREHLQVNIALDILPLVAVTPVPPTHTPRRVPKPPTSAPEPPTSAPEPPTSAPEPPTNTPTPTHKPRHNNPPVPPPP